MLQFLCSSLSSLASVRKKCQSSVLTTSFLKKYQSLYPTELQWWNSEVVKGPKPLQTVTMCTQLSMTQNGWDLLRRVITFMPRFVLIKPNFQTFLKRQAGMTLTLLPKKSLQNMTFCWWTVL
eukprot:Lithocolla_globosa_v1_NODE_5_length_12010_cov_23.451945.p7 type:complete len:122 gc:universal NODE_5_length_12010_cov_23.451945:11081-11446(+)